ncbi:hypothetical protein BJ165DRAFT_1517759, partial [Panaeolus papilionaceus]
MTHICEIVLFVLSGGTGLVGLIKCHIFRFNEYHSFRVLIYVMCASNPTIHTT